jgi:hypothetical protein
MPAEARWFSPINKPPAVRSWALVAFFFVRASAISLRLYFAHIEQRVQNYRVENRFARGLCDVLSRFVDSATMLHFPRVHPVPLLAPVVRFLPTTPPCSFSALYRILVAIHAQLRPPPVPGTTFLDFFAPRCDN